MVKVSVEVAIPKKDSDLEAEVMEIVSRKRQETTSELIDLFQSHSRPG